MNQKYLKEVKQQYEAMPYPARNPEDENKRLIHTFVDYLDIINFYGFRGKKQDYDNFRILVAGGGTGDSLIFLAEQLKETKAQIVYLDISSASLEIARSRANIRGLSNIKYIEGSILDLPGLDIGHFDYINCIGVLHHLDSPEAGLECISGKLKDDGLLAIMLYGKYGRAGIYEMQAMMRYLTKDVPDPEQKIAYTQEMLKALPETNILKKDGRLERADAINGPAALYDLFLHSKDKPFTVPEIYEFLESQGLNLVTFLDEENLHKFKYDTDYYLTDSNLAAQAKKLNLKDNQALAELISGKITAHFFYAAKLAKKLPSIDDLNTVPYFSSYIFNEEIYNSIRQHISQKNDDIITISKGRGKVQIPITKYTGAIFNQLDGNKNIGEIIRAIGEDKKLIHKEIKDTYEAFNKFDWMLLKY